MIRSSVRMGHGLLRSPKYQTILIVLAIAVGFALAYLKIASIPGASETFNDTAEERLAVLGAAAAAAIAIWGVVNQWAISRRQLTIQFLRELETDADYIAALGRFVGETGPGKDMKIYAHPMAPIKAKTKAERRERRRARCDFDTAERAITLVLNTDELIAIGIKNSILDYRLICAYRRNTIIRRYSAAKAYIEELRAVSRVPTLYIEMERFAQRLNGDYYHGLL